MSIAIVGAGLSGSIAAKVLNEAGHMVTVFEKSGGTGGRLSTRRSDEGSFDHGAQYLTARSAEFAKHLDELTKVDAASQWEPAGRRGDHVWHVGRPGMSSLVKPWLTAVNVRTRTRVTEIERSERRVRLTSETGENDEFDAVLVSIPSPQALMLLKGADPVFGRLADVEYAPCWAGMFAFRNRIETLSDVVRGDDDSALAWVARETSKAGRGETERFTVHAGGRWSRDHLEQDKGETASMLLDALSGLAGRALEPVHADAHRWRYARVDKALGVPFLASTDNRIIVCGDGCLGGRAEAAFESGLRAAEHVVEKFGQSQE